MKSKLNRDNVFDYLVEHELCKSPQQTLNNIEPIAAKNFNLLVTLADGSKLLVKQERHNHKGETAGEFLSEWQIQELLQKFSQLNHLRQLLPELLHFDSDNSIIIFRYLDDYRDVMDFYQKENNFHPQISTAIGTLLGTIHRCTFQRQEYEELFLQNSEQNADSMVKNLIDGLERISPDVFSIVPVDGFKFFSLYQKFESLGEGLANVGDAFLPSCVTHNDLKLNNILLHNNWQELDNSSSNNIVRLIDWERSNWGDPAFDLGTTIGSYVIIWLTSLVISKSLSIEESLRLAMTPLEELQPSIASLTKAYFETFTEILEQRPDFLERVVQFVGFGLIQQIQAMIQYQKTFDNTGIAMLQVAKTLLCHPERSVPTIFGVTAAELNPSKIKIPA
ncbi:phosphotransferase family protein [Calothrix sp. CCY 0018]|uniref:phosphotransferase family protein n=1 Tax=Calothrix sp. CCY 0018 TaxID=3103864 RepID=UPI0039C60EDD